MAKFTFKQKLAHYKDVANGNVAVKKGSKFTKKEQIAYAKGQVDARNESNRAYAYKNATPAQRKAFKEKNKLKKFGM